MAVAGWSSSWICGGEDIGQLTVASPCVQRTIIDCVNVVLLVAYVSTLTAACVRQRQCAAAASSRSGAPGWVLLVVSTCCVAAAVAYGVTDLQDTSDVKAAVPYFVRGLVWIALAASLHVQPTRPARAVAVLWWALFSLLVTVYNAENPCQGPQRPGPRGDDRVAGQPPAALRPRLPAAAGPRAPPTGRIQWQQRLVGASDRQRPNRANLGAVPHWPIQPACLLLVEPSAPSRPFQGSGPQDIPLIVDEDTAHHTSRKFSEAWSRHVSDKARSRQSVGSNSLALVLYKCFLGEILFTGFYAFMRTVSTAIAPLLLFAFVWYSNQEERDLRVSLALFGSLLLTKLVESLSQRHWFFDSRRTGMRIQSALMAVIFWKQLRLSSQGRSNHSTGEIINYIAADAYRLGDAISWLHMGWSSPLQLVFAVATLFWALKLGALPGLVPLVIFGFLNVPFAKMLQGYQAKFMVAQDERLRSTSEILNSMKIIKLQSWEDKFRHTIESLRDGEFKWLRPK
ncbi:unnamed protein product [Miscanthus lutarioriparius]|uniref:ABC transmembrane type-1 domain-containing protein n=1 Tax=Miscanthus lutarioriparius TaxID=422564 RepID=A0A811SES5_9POAL|nr:unnamed protein product [Miscanthus lutarioriparius]